MNEFVDWIAEMDKCQMVEYRAIPVEDHYDVAKREWVVLCRKLIEKLDQLEQENTDLHIREAGYGGRITGLRMEVERQKAELQRVEDKHEQPETIVTPTIKNNDCPLVMIEWVDSAQPQSSWKFLEDVGTPESIHCVSVGWLVADGKTNKSVAPNMGNVNSPDSMQVSGVITIPVCSIVKITIL